MIGRLRGAVAEVGEEEALIDVMGVGYVVRCGARTLSRLPEIGGEALLHVESHFGEQTGLTLYGFLSRDDRQAFVLLRTIQGVGPKVLFQRSPMSRYQSCSPGIKCFGKVISLRMSFPSRSSTGSASCARSPPNIRKSGAGFMA